MNLRVNLAGILLLFTLRINFITCLKCHVCNSLKYPGCEAIPMGTTRFLQNCSSPNDVTCRTQEQWVDFNVLGQKHEKRIIRQCASTPFDADRACYYRTGFGGKVNVCNCLGDACNSATKAGSSFLLLLLGFYFISKMF